MLGELAQQFGQALGMRGALRSALGEFNEKTQRWEAHKPDPKKLAAAHEPHARGAILLAAIFSAFLSIYKMRSADLFRIATNGTGVLGEGSIHPDLVRRLAREAANAADAVLTMCIRGLDYCPPVDVDFGTYLRGVITADTEVWPAETYPYRVAFIEAFRQWGIFPEGVRGDVGERAALPPPRPRRWRRPSSRARYDQAHTKDIFERLQLHWGLDTGRKTVWNAMNENAKIIHRWLTGETMRDQLQAWLTLTAARPVYRDKDGVPSIEVHSVRVRRRGFRDTLVTDLVVEVRQRRRGYFDRAVQEAIDAQNEKSPLPKADFRFRRGCTLIIDPVTQEVRYAIATRGDVTDNDELDRVRRFLTGEADRPENPFYGPHSGTDSDGEPFAVLHRRTATNPDF